MATIDFYYEGKNITIQCNKYEQLAKIFQRFLIKANVGQNSVNFIYNGNIITNMSLTLEQLSNRDDKNRNKMNILVSKSLINPSSQFIFEKNTGADESMKDYAKMTILLAMQEYPDDDIKKSFLIMDKFEEKYEGFWSCSFVKDGGTAFHYFDVFMGIKYGGYKITIAKTGK